MVFDAAKKDDGIVKNEDGLAKARAWDYIHIIIYMNGLRTVNSQAGARNSQERARDS